jgi:hypothetical protein
MSPPRATVALADRERIAEPHRLQAAQSIVFAMTELCKGRPATYQPGTATAKEQPTPRRGQP